MRTNCNTFLNNPPRPKLGISHQSDLFASALHAMSVSTHDVGASPRQRAFMERLNGMLIASMEELQPRMAEMFGEDEANERFFPDSPFAAKNQDSTAEVPEEEPLDLGPLTLGFPTLPKWDKLMELGMLPLDIETEANNWKGYADGRNLYEWTDDTWKEMAQENGVDADTVSADKAKELPMMFVFGFGDEEKTALVDIIQGWGLDRIPAIDLANAVCNVLLMPIVSASMDGESAYATETGKIAFGGQEAINAGFSRITGGTPLEDDDENP